MLVLSRKAQEQIRIGNEIVITVVRVRGQRVCIGIEAPDHIRVRRAELGPVSPDESPTMGDDPAPAPPTAAEPPAEASHGTAWTSPFSKQVPTINDLSRQGPLVSRLASRSDWPAGCPGPRSVDRPVPAWLRNFARGF